MTEDRTNAALLSAGSLSFVVAALHVAIIVGGPDWYRFFGAGEQMAVMAEQGQLYPAILTMGLVLIFVVWGFYAWSGAGVLPRLPFLRFSLVAITAIYCIRGLYGFLIPAISDHPYVTDLGTAFWMWSTAISLTIGLVHMVGLRQAWPALQNISSRGQAIER